MKPPAKLSVANAINRGFNQLTAVIFGVMSLTFGGLLFEETDPIDKVDNTLLVVVGVVAVVWYLWKQNGTRRSAVPVGLAGAALVAQLFGSFVEFSDPISFGDDIAGLTLTVALVVVLAVLYATNGKLLAVSAPTAT